MTRPAYYGRAEASQFSITRIAAILPPTAPMSLRYAKAAGLVVLRNGTRDLALWDGTSFLLKAVS